MSAFDRFFYKDTFCKKTVEIHYSLYEKLKELSKTKYEATTNKLINAAIDELIRTENITILKKPENEISEQHSLLIRQSLIDGLEKLKEKYDLSLYKLINIAIKNAIDEEEEKDKLAP